MPERAVRTKAMEFCCSSPGLKRQAQKITGENELQGCPSPGGLFRPRLSTRAADRNHWERFPQRLCLACTVEDSHLTGLGIRTVKGPQMMPVLSECLRTRAEGLMGRGLAPTETVHTWASPPSACIQVWQVLLKSDTDPAGPG